VSDQQDMECDISFDNDPEFKYSCFRHLGRKRESDSSPECWL